MSVKVTLDYSDEDVRNYLRSLVRQDLRRVERKRIGLGRTFGTATDYTRSDAKIEFVKAVLKQLETQT